MFKNKLIKLFLMLGVILFGLVCTGCHNSKEKVNVDFRMGTETEIVTIEKGTVITNDIIPFKDNLENIELYYDDNKSNKYNDEPIQEDITIYAYMKGNGEIEITEEQIREDYLKYAHLHGKENLTIDDIQIVNNYGQYDDMVIVRIGWGGFCVITPMIFGGLMQVGGFYLRIDFPDTNIPLVYKDGNFYELGDAYYKEGIITRKALIQLKNQIEGSSKE